MTTFISEMDKKADLTDSMTRYKELNVLNICYDMLKEPAVVIGWTKNSGESAISKRSRMPST